jgi:Asp-tRNA(Asn)/Glu-tRNA(Gln) amidotransferase C subunit
MKKAELSKLINNFKVKADEKIKIKKLKKIEIKENSINEIFNDLEKIFEEMKEKNDLFLLIQSFNNKFNDIQKNNYDEK